MSFLSCFSPKPKEDGKDKGVSEAAASPVEIPPLSNGGAANGFGGAKEYSPDAELSGFDSAREADPAPVTAMAQIVKPKAKSSKKADPSQRFVKELPKHPEYR